jgi:nucleotide-binding universal stress UspA family protein
MPTQHFLVPIDFSAYSDQALTYAITLATQLRARLTLLHVIHELSMVMGDMASALPEAYLQELAAEAQRGLEERLTRVHEAGLEGDIVLVHGVPFQRIIDTAHDQKVDLIVMGTQGRTGLSHALMGSVAEKVVRLAPCPVLVAREAASTAVL